MIPLIDLCAGIPVGVQLVDTDTVVSAAVAAALKTQGVAGVIRYLSRSIPQHPGDLSAAEIAAIRGAGLGVMAVQHVAPARRWAPSKALGEQYGLAAVANARGCGLPEGMTIALDLEDPMPCAAADTIAYVNAWCGAVAGEGYETMLYVGPNCGLDSHQLYWRLACRLYWKSASRVPDVSVRGYAMRQSLPVVMAGIAVDQSVVTGDALGAAPHWWAP